MKKTKFSIEIKISEDDIKRAIEEVLEIMTDLAKAGMTMVVVSHEMGFAKTVADRVIFMDEGKIIETKKTKDFFENPENDRTKLFLSQILR